MANSSPNFAPFGRVTPQKRGASYLSRYGKRLMFGSDQMVWPEAIGMAVEGVESATFLTE